jgi:hypothetical protein
VIESNNYAFPQNAVHLISEHVKTGVLDDGGTLEKRIAVFRRPLRNTDPNQSFGIFGNLWQPNLDSFEMGRGMRGGVPGPNEPTLQTFTLGAQAFVKDMDEERGLAAHSVFAERVRVMLYRDETLRVGLASLSTVAGGRTQRAKNWGIRTQRLISNELDGAWLYLSTLEFWIETETV